MVAVNTALAARLIAELDEDLDKDRGRIGKVRRYLKGDHDLPYMPKGAKREYRDLAERAITNWLPLITDTFAQRLFVDGYRAPKSGSNAAAWEHWQANRLDARQTIAHRGAINYGTSYVLVLPGKPAPLIQPLSPTRS